MAGHMAGYQDILLYIPSSISSTGCPTEERKWSILSPAFAVSQSVPVVPGVSGGFLEVSWSLSKVE